MLPKLSEWKNLLQGLVYRFGTLPLILLNPHIVYLKYKFWNKIKQILLETLECENDYIEVSQLINYLRNYVSLGKRNNYFYFISSFIFGCILFQYNFLTLTLLYYSYIFGCKFFHLIFLFNLIQGYWYLSLL